MTCRHVLDLIDAGTLTDAAEKHAQQCATCGPALAAATALTARLVALPQPEPPAHLAAAVLARIARMDSDASKQAHSTTATPAAMGARDWSRWASLTGVAAGLALVMATVPVLGVRGITTNLVVMPSTTTGALGLGAGLLLYAAGLFVPVRLNPRLRQGYGASENLST
jgi:hypothetical protein